MKKFENNVDSMLNLYNYSENIRKLIYTTNPIESLNSCLRKRYDEQFHHFNEVKSNNSELQRLIDLIHNERKAYDQEGYICNSIFLNR